MATEELEERLRRIREIAEGRVRYTPGGGDPSILILASPDIPLPTEEEIASPGSACSYMKAHGIKAVVFQGDDDNLMHRTRHGNGTFCGKIIEPVEARPFPRGEVQISFPAKKPQTGWCPKCWEYP